MKSKHLYFVILIIILADCHDVHCQRLAYNGLPLLRAVSKGYQLETSSNRHMEPYQYVDTVTKYISSNHQLKNIEKNIGKTLVPPSLINKKEDYLQYKISLLDAFKSRTNFHERLYPLSNCKEELTNDLNENGELMDSNNNIFSKKITRKHITSTTVETPLEKTTTKWYYRKMTSTTPLPIAVNCRLVMKSELNENYEIIDSVTEVCDAPATTTTMTALVEATTKKPIRKTTPTPLVNVCWPVMNSVLDDNGEIIDSVTEICSLIPAT